MNKITTLEMELALMHHFDFRRNYIVPNITDMSFLTRFEVDLLILSKSYYATGIEIKVSKADLKKDLQKRRFVNIEKNGNLFNVYYKNIKQFYYAVPDYLQEDALNQIPEFSGVIVATRLPTHNLKIRVKREAKVIGKQKWTDKMVHDLLRLGTMRIYNLKNRILHDKQFQND